MDAGEEWGEADLDRGYGVVGRGWGWGWDLCGWVVRCGGVFLAF